MLTVNNHTRYTDLLNELVKSPGRIESKLKLAVTLYENEINKLKPRALLSDNGDLATIYNSHMLMLEQIAKYIKSAECFETKFSILEPVVTDILSSASTAIQNYDLVSTEKRLTEISQFLSYFSSSIDAARLLGDIKLTVDAIGDYLRYVYEQSSTDTRCSELVFNATTSNETCLNAITGLISNFDQLLQETNFPRSDSSAFENTDMQPLEDEQLDRISTMFTCLASVNLCHLNVLLEKPLLDQICLPMHVILRSLEKRFRYHFTGDRRTNRIDKPEWYMTQTLQWIRDNDYILTVLDRDFLSKAGYAGKIRTEFIRGLMILLTDKLNADLGLVPQMPTRYSLPLNVKSTNTEPLLVAAVSSSSNAVPSGELLENTEYFSHLVDTLLQTDARLMQLAYTTEHPRPSDILSLPEVFQRWITLELSLAFRRLDGLLSANNAWDVPDESNRRPQCADDFHALLHAVGLRSRQLDDKLSRSRFLRLQLHLIRAFFLRIRDYSQLSVDPQSSSPTSLFTIRRSRSPTGGYLGRHLKDALSALSGGSKFGWGSEQSTSDNQKYLRWIGAINALSYLHDTIAELANDPYYVSFYEDLSMRAFLEQPDPWLLDFGLCAEEAGPLSVEPDGGTEQSSALHGGVFTQVLHLYHNGVNRMLTELVDTIFTKLRCLSRAYVTATEYWLHTDQSGVFEPASLQVSGPSFSLFSCIRDCLHLLQTTLHPKLFAVAWKQLARAVDDLLYNELIMANRFTPNGATQLRYDLTHHLYPSFALFTELPESCFPQTRDAVILLTLFRGSAELLRSALRDRLRSGSNPLGPLLELGVTSLTPDEAERILSLRASP